MPKIISARRFSKIVVDETENEQGEDVISSMLKKAKEDTTKYALESFQRNEAKEEAPSEKVPKGSFLHLTKEENVNVFEGNYEDQRVNEKNKAEQILQKNEEMDKLQPIVMGNYVCVGIEVVRNEGTIRLENNVQGNCHYVTIQRVQEVILTLEGDCAIEYYLVLRK